MEDETIQGRVLRYLCKKGKEGASIEEMMKALNLGEKQVRDAIDRLDEVVNDPPQSGRFRKGD